MCTSEHIFGRSLYTCICISIDTLLVFARRALCVIHGILVSTPETQLWAHQSVLCSCCHLHCSKYSFCSDLNAVVDSWFIFHTLYTARRYQHITLTFPKNVCKCSVFIILDNWIEFITNQEPSEVIEIWSKIKMNEKYGSKLIWF